MGKISLHEQRQWKMAFTMLGKASEECGEAARAPGCGVHATAGKPLGGGREAARAGQMVCYGFSFRLSVRVRTVCFVLVTCALDLLMAALRTDYCTFNSTR
ncbi:unnamed protein product [Prorocentrum cordatum]|uniref:Uncharacterized protein n=1 Tax=Prorocentrum cordatum TaxID=2364126 RepID=A0ABN9Q0K3_9DINO|nr:unnamed protein product [Polarella glacialis]